MALSALQAQNSLTVSDVAMKQGETAVISVGLNNETEFTAFHLRLKLPEGFEVATTVNEDGDEVLDIVLNAERKKSSHILQSLVLEDGAISVASISTKSATFSGTSGEILQIRLVATDAAVAGDYAMQLYSAYITTTDAEDIWFEDMEVGLNYSASVPDIPVNPDDPDVPVNPDDPDEPEEPVAPVNEVSATDLYLEGEDGFAILSVELDNETEFSGFQMDLMLPEGFVVATTMNEDDEEVLDIALGEDRKKSTHTLEGDVVSSGAVRVTSISLANAIYKGTSGEIVQFRIVPTAAAKSGTYTAEISNVIFSTPEGVEYRLSSVSVQIVYKASQGGEVEFPSHSLTLLAGQYGRCIVDGYVIEPNESHILSNAIKHGESVRLFFVPFDGYKVSSLKRNGEVVAIQDNMYEETVKGDVAFTEVNYVRLSEEIEELPEPIITFDAGEVSIECERDDVTILYAINGNPLEGDVYVEPFTVPERSVVSAVAVRVSKVAELTIIASDMEESPKRVAARRYYKENGIRVASAEEGVTIVVDEYEDGSMQAYKVVGN